MASKLYLAFYKHKREIKDHSTLFMRIADEITRFFTRGPYTHCELAVSREDGRYDCFSSSYRDKGVRMKTMVLEEHKWDLIELEADIDALAEFHEVHKAMGYDLAGALGIVLGRDHRQDQLFCSEYCAKFLGYADAWRIDPNDLYSLLKGVHPWVKQEGEVNAD